MTERPFSQEDLPAIVAHRGASAIEAENTLAAFAAAIEAGADAVEMDVRLTTDEEPVVMHDATVDRTTDGTGLVRELALEDLRRLSIRTASGGVARIPTLEEALSILGARTAAVIEIKNLPGEPDFDASAEPSVDATAHVVDRMGLEGRVLIVSFSPRSLARSRLVMPGEPTGLLTDIGVPADEAVAEAASDGADWVLPFVTQVLDADASLVVRAHEAGIRVGTWLTDDPDEAIRLMRRGLDAVATNDPGPILAARREAFGS